MAKKIAVLGSTGSIGTQTLDVIDHLGYEVTVLSANSSIDLLEEQARKYRPPYVAVANESAARALAERLRDLPVSVLCGEEGLKEAASLEENDIIVNAVVGIAGLVPTMAALEAGKTLALANKESLVAGGRLVLETAQRTGAQILPVDSEHSAIFQCLWGDGHREHLQKILLTASGGPFFGMKKEDLQRISVEDTLRHPTWNMGGKITVDSATLMNKGLELIEAVWLFGLRPEQVEIVVHRESVVHSAVEFADGSVIAQMGVPDMRLPIQLALTYPERLPGKTRPLSLTEYGSLTFYPPDFETFDCLRSCVRAIEMGGLMPCVVNGANEEAVGLFLQKKIPFLKIGELVEASLSLTEYRKEANSMEDIKRADGAARAFVRAQIG
ncbi:1-deoxy-D-xylulose-5-phosphate reductoisomerase [Zongyangia hominis]|uniref:1-deoxy-D-xylulose 5-phosphate reductoisomerase n=1 Tax=Zongyangia hominis TaxID=2763677 RepID=A0A926EDE5_9FIRM|nr:1-deoxy-D-xylulose-5-phosphate reductoisomerase [Zongyangia hominis]MBC8569712.1 1-deoxy-D-xylulose-5-phosphate reductoisomerase [Zongyangia hominis]